MFTIHTGPTRGFSKKWLTKASIQREFKSGQLQYYITRNRFTNGAIYAQGAIKRNLQLLEERSERLQIQPMDFLRSDLLAEELRTNRLRKDLFDSLVAMEESKASRPQFATLPAAATRAESRSERLPAEEAQ
jgi:hypothetical protein